MAFWGENNCTVENSGHHPNDFLIDVEGKIKQIFIKVISRIMQIKF